MHETVKPRRIRRIHPAVTERRSDVHRELGDPGMDVVSCDERLVALEDLDLPSWPPALD